MGRASLVLLFLLIFPAAAHAGSPLDKLDPRARAALASLRMGSSRQTMIENQMAIGAQGELNVLIGGSVSRAELEAAGARVRTALPGIFTAYVPAGSIESVASLPGVTRIQGSAPVEIELDNSIQAIGVSALRGAGPSFSPLNGKGVLVGDVDTGVDFHHDDFKDPAGKTRFIHIWDQTGTSGSVPPQPFGYGLDWRSGQIDSAQCTETDDVSGHGTHVMGILGGDGSGTGNGVAAYTYAGVAPKADLIMVKTNFNTASILDGVQYVFDRATERGQPAVVNLSLGSQFGPHDGTDLFESGLSAMTGPGRIIVKSAGNDRGIARHADVFAAGGGTNVTLSVAGSSTASFVGIDGYYNSTENVSVKITTPNATVIGPITRGNLNAGYPGQSTLNGTVYLENGSTAQTSGDFEVYVEVNVGSGQNMNGTWTFTFLPVTLGAAGGEVDLWRYGSSGSVTASFVTGNSPNQELISEPGNADSLITAAAWVTKQSWTGCNGLLTQFGGTPPVGNIAPFSSPGPTRYGKQKPDITAPGEAIASTAVLSQSCPGGFTGLLGDGQMHVIMAGTSMAAPHVSGAAALLLQTEPLSPPAKIKSLLFQAATVDGFTGAVWNLDWGHGKLHLDQATATLVSLFQASSAGSTVELRWRMGGASSPDVSIERADRSTGPWVVITTERRVESDLTIATDRSVEVGRTYFYRLNGVASNGDRYTFGPLAVTAGAPISDLALLPIRPNPSVREARVNFAIPHPMDVSLGVFDVQGRQVALLARGIHPAGQYQATWTGVEAPGLYFVRLVTPERSLMQRVAIVR
jgi:subtilisin family serine protease